MPELWQKSDLAQTLEVVKGLEGAPDLKAIASNTRIRQVWTRERWKLLNRLSKVLEEEGVKMRLVCHLAQCPDKAIKIANGRHGADGRGAAVRLHRSGVRARMTGPLPLHGRLVLLGIAWLLAILARRTSFVADRFFYALGVVAAAALVLADVILWW
jgi:hypothetical protein